MNRTMLILLIILLLSPVLHAGQSVIIEGEGYACMGDDKSRKTTEQVAVSEAKRQASESALSYISSRTDMKDGMLEKDLVNSYSNAVLKVLQELKKEWYKDQASGECYRIRLKVEVVPDEKTMERLAKKVADDPLAPLSVQVWTDKTEYREGEKIKVYLRGNKPFFARVVYTDASGNLVQLLPNPYRSRNYFQGGALYELPSGDDRYEMDATAPFGTEKITVYASTAEVGQLDVAPAGGVYEVKTRPAEVSSGTRGVKLVSTGSGSNKPVAAEFAETEATLKTRK